jgi:ABC-2 type transport system permease protein
MLGVIGCLSMLVQGIAGEKFGRISEMVLTALPAQTWLDGKIIAATLHGLKTIVSYAIYTSLAAVVMGFVKLSVVVDLLAQLSIVGLLVLICVLGLCFWNCFFALIAAILPSEQSAIRNTLPILPISFLLISLTGAKHPQSAFLEFLSIFPPSSMAAMPVRLLNGAVPTLDVILALIFSVITIALLRFFAGRVFVYATISAGSPTTILDYINFSFRGKKAAR